MDWRKIRFLPVEDNKGKLIGLVTARILMRYFSKNYMKDAPAKPATVKDIMIKKPITIHPEANVLETMETLESNNIGCLPVVIEGKLIGIVTAEDFLKINKSLVIRFSKKKK